MSKKSKPYKVRKPKPPKEKKEVHAKWYWFLLAALPIVLICGVLLWQTGTFGGKKEEPQRYNTATDGDYDAFETLGVEVYLPTDLEEYTPYQGASYSKVRLDRFNSGNAKYAVGVAAIPNESNQEYNLNTDADVIAELVHNRVSQQMAEVFNALKPSLSGETTHRALFDGYDGIEEHGTCEMYWSYLALSGDDDTPEDEREITYTEEVYIAKYYMITILYNNRPIVAWGAWDPSCSVGRANIRQVVVDALASIVGTDTIDTSGEAMEAVGSSLDSIVWDWDDEVWISDFTGEVVTEVPPASAPDFVEKYQAYMMKLHEGEEGFAMAADHDHDHGEMMEEDHNHDAEMNMEDMAHEGDDVSHVDHAA